MLFVTASLVNLVAISYGNDVAASCAKPFLMPFLGLTAYFCLKEKEAARTKIAACVMAALAFATAGDIFLMFSGKGFFMAGVAAFFAAHVCYFLVFLKLTKGKRLSGSMHDLLIAGVAVLAMIILLQFIIKEASSFSLGMPMGLIVLIYALVFPLNVYFSAYGSAFCKPLWITAFGYVFFAFSDGLIALNAFKGIDFASRHLLVMLTYIVAQAMIVTGIVRSVRSC